MKEGEQKKSVHKKKRLLVFCCIVSGIVIASAGCWGIVRASGAKDTIAKQKTSAEDETVSTSDTIAVVNLDNGVESDEQTINYASKLMTDLESNFTITGLEDARNGISNGTYGAYIIIPATFSECAVSFNDTPQQAEIEYDIDENLSDDVKEQVIYDVLDFTSKLDSDLSYMYVNSILEEFHDTQDHITTVMNNDIEDKEVILNLKPNDLVTAVPIAELEELPEEGSYVDISDYIETNLQFSDSMDSKYQYYISLSEDEYNQLMEQSGELLSEWTSMEKTINTVDFLHDSEGTDLIESGLEATNGLLKIQNQSLSEKSEEITEVMTAVSEDIKTTNEKLTESIEAYNDSLLTKHSEAASDITQSMDDGTNISVTNTDGTLNIAGTPITINASYDTSEAQAQLNMFKEYISYAEENMQEMTDEINRLNEVIEAYESSGRTENETGSGTETGEASETGSGTEIGEASETGSGTETGEASETGSGTETEEASETGSGTETGEASETGSESETGTTNETDAVTESTDSEETDSADNSQAEESSEEAEQAEAAAQTVQAETESVPEFSPSSEYLAASGWSSWSEFRSAVLSGSSLSKKDVAIDVDNLASSISNTVNQSISEQIEGQEDTIQSLLESYYTDYEGMVLDEDKNELVDEDTGQSIALTDLLTNEQENIQSLLDNGLAKIDAIQKSEIKEELSVGLIDPLTARTEEVKENLVNQYETEKLQLVDYETAVTQYDPLEKVDQEELSGIIGDMENNGVMLQKTLIENDETQTEYVNKVYETTQENIDKLKENIQKAKEASDEAVENGLAEAQSAKAENSKENQSLLADITTKLAYTRLGSLEYTKVNEFIVNPLSIVEVRNKEIKEKSVATQDNEKTDAQADIDNVPMEYMGLIVLGIIALTVAGVAIKRLLGKGNHIPQE